VHHPQIDNILFLWGGSSEFTGISAPYEPPLNAEVHIKTAECEVNEAVQMIADYLLEKGYITGVHN
jgi:adenylylsulfate kinase